MVITRTPFRISFFGGGTDYPCWYRYNKGAVLTTTIDKYCYISCRHLPPFFEHKHRIVYSIIEMVKEIEEIKHPAVRGVLKYLNIDFGVEIHHDGDLPARTGLGSSSSFTVGLLNALYGLLGKMKSKEELAKEAIYIEQEVLKENVGCQDQIEVAYGGLNKITFLPDDSFVVEPVILPPGKKEEFEKYLLLYFTGISRYASEIASEQIKNIEKKKYELKILHEMVEEGIKILVRNDDLKEFGKLLDEAWQFKRSLSEKISNPTIDELYEKAKKIGVIGGKLLGAGGGGFMLFFAPPELHQKIKEEIKGLFVPFKFENQGSQIIFYQV
ncbi:MAG: kinase [bacterium]|nr:kinase [bacterium]MDW8163687.1 kinase [Candidatus Omnitrophota bacterium]